MIAVQEGQGRCCVECGLEVSRDGAMEEVDDLPPPSSPPKDTDAVVDGIDVEGVEMQVRAVDHACVVLMCALVQCKCIREDPTRRRKGSSCAVTVAASARRDRCVGEC